MRPFSWHVRPVASSWERGWADFINTSLTWRSPIGISLWVPSAGVAHSRFVAAVFVFTPSLWLTSDRITAMAFPKQGRVPKPLVIIFKPRINAD